jgi:hypothetical protein
VDGESLADDPTLTSADAYSGYWRFGEQPAQSPPEDSPDAAASVGAYLAGTLDEVRFSTDEPSDAWIKLCYATQRPNATAVVYPPLP